MRLTTSIPRQGTRTRYRRSLTWLMLRGQAVHPAIAQRFSAMAHCSPGHETGHARSWPHPRCQPRAPAAGVRKAPRHEIAVGERRRCSNYGDFAAGSGVDAVERGGNVGTFVTRHVRELNCERVTDRLVTQSCAFAFCRTATLT